MCISTIGCVDPQTKINTAVSTQNLQRTHSTFICSLSFRAFSIIKGILLVDVILYIISANKQVQDCTFDSAKEHIYGSQLSRFQSVAPCTHARCSSPAFLQHKLNLNHCSQFSRGIFCTPFNDVTQQRFKKCCSTLTVQNIWMCAVQVDDIFGYK